MGRTDLVLNPGGERDDEPLVSAEAVDPGCTTLDRGVLAAAFETAESLIVVHGADGRILRVNPACVRVLGWSSEEMVGQNALSFLAPGQYEATVEEHVRLLDGDRAQHTTRRWLCRDGLERTISFTRTPVRGPDGKVRCVVATGVDVTGEQRALEAVRASERRHRALVEHASDVVVLLDADGVVHYLSPSAEAILGWRPAEVEGRSGIDLVDAADRELAVRSLAEALAEPGPTAPLELHVMSRDGRSVPMEVVANNRTEDPTLSGVILHMRDITERRSLELTLDAAEERFREAFATSPTGIAVVDLDGHFLDVNPALADILGRDAGELGNLTFQDITHPDDVAADIGYTQRLLDGELEGYRMEKRYLRPDGTIVWGLLNVSLVRRADGSPQHFLSHVEDITARKSLTEELARLAHHDGLTGLANRRSVHARVNEALARRHLHGVGALFVDLDGFKDVNDTYGHDVGDRVLSVVARRLADVVRPSDLVGRVGGDEFVVVCEPASPAVLGSVARRIERELDRPVELAGHEAIPIGATVGLAAADATDDVASLLRRADEDMYRGKSGRRGATDLAENHQLVP